MNSGKSTNVLFFGIVIPLLFLSGCASTKGTVSDGKYYAPLNNFVMPLPPQSGFGGFGGVKVEDKNDAVGGMVSVLDAAGYNEGITYASLPASSETVLTDPLKRDSAFRGFVYDYALPSLFRPVSAQSKVVHEEFLGSGPDRAFLAIVVIPEASSVMNAKTGKRWDSVRSLLVFDKSRFMYMLHSEMVTALFQVNATSLTNKDLEAARKNMQRMRASIRFQ